MAQEWLVFMSLRDDTNKMLENMRGEKYVSFGEIPIYLTERNRVIGRPDEVDLTLVVEENSSVHSLLSRLPPNDLAEAFVVSNVAVAFKAPATDATEST